MANSNLSSLVNYTPAQYPQINTQIPQYFNNEFRKIQAAINSIEASLTDGPAFSAYLSANQTGIVGSLYTQIAFNTLAFQNGGFYNTATYTWTPPAGLVKIGAQVFGATGCGGGINDGFVAKVYKNGLGLGTAGSRAFLGGASYTGEPGTAQCNGEALFQANGTDYFNIFLDADWNAAVTSISWAGSVATLTFALAQGLPATFSGTVSLATPSGYNGTFTMTTVDAFHVTYPLASNPGSSSGAALITGNPISIDSNAAHSFFYGYSL